MIFRRKTTNKRTRQPQLMEGQDDLSFRRSRTLQGTTSSSVKSANRKRTQLQSKRLKKQQQHRRRQLAITGFFSLVIIALGLYYLISQYSAEVKSVSFTPNTTQSPSADMYKKATKQYLDAQPAERFRFALNEKGLSQFVTDKLPEVKRVQSSGKGSFKIELRRPVASWEIAHTQSFVDEEGSSFTRNYFETPSVVVIDNSGANTEKDGRAVVSERFLHFLGRLVSILNASGIGKVSEASLPKGTAREIDIKIDTRPYIIKTHIDRDPAATVEDIKRVVGYLDQRQLSASYVDVRVVGRAFYR